MINEKQNLCFKEYQYQGETYLEVIVQLKDKGGSSRKKSAQALV